MEPDTTVRNRRNCSPLPPEELKRFRSLLAQRRAEILQSCEGLSQSAMRRPGENAADDTTVTDDVADLAADVCEQDLSLNLIGRQQSELGDIDRALERIDWRSYGLCDGCGQPIPVARLEAIPTALTCIECKSKSESEAA
jgi:RNA polymerase-binding protein DksA